MSNDAGADTRIVLVRHGHVEAILPPRFRGQTDLPLTARGTPRAKMTPDLLAYLPRPAAACASPLSRCMTTAGIIVQPPSLPVVPMPSFLDINYGDWQGRSYQDVQQADPEGFARWFDARHLAVIPGGKTPLQLAGRVAETMHASSPDTAVKPCCWSGTIQSIVPICYSHSTCPYRGSGTCGGTPAQS
jgi:phosphoserine phosphatase